MTYVQSSARIIISRDLETRDLEKTRKETRDRDISTSSGPITSFFINISFGLNLVSDDFQLFIIGCVRFGCVGAIFLYSHNGFTQMFSHDLFLVL